MNRAIIIDTLLCERHAARGRLTDPAAQRILGTKVEILGGALDGCSCCVSVSIYTNVRGTCNGLPVCTRRDNLRSIDPLETEVETEEEAIA